VPGIQAALAEQVVEAVQRIRKLDLKKSPSISETLDWAKTLTLLNADRLDEAMVSDTLSTVLKYEGDIRKAQDGDEGVPANPARPSRRSAGGRQRPAALDRDGREDRRFSRRLLRANGLRVSLAEHLDAFHAVAGIGIGDRQALKDILRATMVKRSIDVGRLRRAVRPVLLRAWPGRPRGGPTNLMRAMQVDEQQLQNLMDHLAEILEQLDIDLSDLARALLQNDTGRLEKTVARSREQANAAGIERSYQEGRYSHSTAQSIGLGGLSEELDRVRQQLGRADLPPDLAAQLEQFIEQRAARLARDDPSARCASSSRSAISHNASATGWRRSPRRASTICPRTSCAACAKR
jgi:hypothetical protein